MRLFRTLSLAVLLIVMASADAAAQAPRFGAPETLRLSRTGDERLRPGALLEWWRLEAVERSGAPGLEIMLERSDEVGVAVTLDTERAIFMPQVPDPSAGAVRFASADAGTELRRTDRGWLLTLAGTGVDGQVVTGRIELRHARPGPTATRWRLPPNPVDRSARHLSWSSLAATSTLRGELSIDGRKVALDGWRASLEHLWGRVDGPRGWRYGQSFAVHLPRGGAVVAFGLDREDAAIGWGARDGQWLGVLAKLRRGRTRLCRPVIQRREWNVAQGFFTDPYAERMRARCGRLAVDFRRASEHNWGGGGPGWYRISWPATANGRGAGVGTVLGWR